MSLLGAQLEEFQGGIFILVDCGRNGQIFFGSARTSYRAFDPVRPDRNNFPSSSPVSPPSPFSSSPPSVPSPLVSPVTLVTRPQSPQLLLLLMLLLLLLLLKLLGSLIRKGNRPPKVPSIHFESELMQPLQLLSDSG